MNIDKDIDKEIPQKLRYGRNVTNKWFFRQRVCYMPRLRNAPPYDSNQIVQWFASQYSVDFPQAEKLFHAAISLSRQSAKANPDKWPPFLLFDHQTRQWHGSDIP